MSTALERRMTKLEKVRDRNDVGSEVDRMFEKMGTSRAAVLADFGTLAKFRDWLAAGAAAEDQIGQVQQSTVGTCREWRGDPAISAKWGAFFDRSEAVQSADHAA